MSETMLPPVSIVWIVLLFGFSVVASAQQGADREITPCPRPLAFTSMDSNRFKEPAYTPGAPKIAPGVAFKCLGLEQGYIHAEFSDGGSGWLLPTGVVFEDPRVFFTTPDKKIGGFLTGVLYTTMAYALLDTLFLQEASLNGIKLKELRIPIDSVKRIAIRSTVLEIETEANTYIVKKVDADNSALQPRLFMDGKWVYIGSLPMGVLERRLN